MEACPKIPMLTFELKTCNYDSTDFGEKILHVKQPENFANFRSKFSNLFLLFKSTYLLTTKKIPKVIRKK